MKSFRQKILDFILTNPFLRKVNAIIGHNIIPLLLKFIVLVLTLIIFFVIALKLFLPDKFDQVSHKASSYFFYYFSLSGNDFDQINISGNDRTQRAEVIKIVNLAKRDFPNKEDFRYKSAIENLIDDIQTHLHWVKEVTISRSLPNVLNIDLVEYVPFAIWQSGNRKYIIDRNGSKIPFEDIKGLGEMIILSGDSANVNARSLFNIFTIDSSLSRNVYSATWVGNRRWDIRFENGLLIKLPENDIAIAWQNLIKIYNMPGSIIGLKMIDLRITGKIYLEYEDSAMKELQKI
jgi:cell division protein FtsQ